MRFNPRFIPYLLLIVALASCSDGHEKADGVERAPDDTIVRMEPFRLMEPKMSADYVNRQRTAISNFVNKTWRSEKESLSFLVAQNGQILYEKYQGDADRIAGTKIEAGTPLHIASVSKVMTATAILEYVDAGRLELDQKVNTILSGFPYEEVTVRHLLNHRSGLQNYAYYFDQPGKWDKKVPLTNKDILERYISDDVPLAFMTDRRFTYCNTNYAMLALIIEKLSGKSYPEAMKQMVFDPLGMNDTYVFEIEKHRETAVPSYFAHGVEIALDFLDAVYGDKNIFSTPRDILKFDMARYSPDFLTPQLKKQVYVGYSFENKGERNYGLGIRMIDWFTGQHFYFHNGWWHGNTSSYVNLKKEKVMIIALSNRYSTKPYKVRFLSKLFGDYPFKEDDAD